MDAMLAKAEKYVGTPYLPGEFDCADLAAKVQWELFNRLISLPQHRRRPRGVMGQARMIRSLQGELAEPITAPETGCGVLMYEPNEHGESLHIGTGFVAGGEIWVLHNSFTMGCAWLQRLPDLQRIGLRLEGFYRWRSA